MVQDQSFHVTALLTIRLPHACSGVNHLHCRGSAASFRWHAMIICPRTQCSLWNSYRRLLLYIDVVSFITLTLYVFITITSLWRLFCRQMWQVNKMSREGFGYIALFAAVFDVFHPCSSWILIEVIRGFRVRPLLRIVLICWITGRVGQKSIVFSGTLQWYIEFSALQEGFRRWCFSSAMWNF